MIYAAARNLGITPEEALRKISYINLLMYANATPSYDSAKAKKEDWDDSIDANNPDNFTNNQEEEEVIR